MKTKRLEANGQTPEAKLESERKYSQTPRGKYRAHKRNAKARGVLFELTFDQWLDVWVKSGKFDQRGNKIAFGYVMARKGDKGPYSVGNVRIATHADNVAERNRNFAYAKRMRIDWDWYKNAPQEPEQSTPELLDSSIPF